MKFNRFAFKFYSILLIEALFLPVLALVNVLKKITSSNDSSSRKIFRKPVTNEVVHVCVHEWGGYPLVRKKKIKGGESFTCGLLYQLDRFKTPVEGFRVELTVTLSDSSVYEHLSQVESNCSEVISVSNKGMDFAGYSAFFNKLREKENSYVILSNSSVNSEQGEFLRGYIDYLEKNPDVGMLGVSYCTKVIQTLVRNNFRPHLQSFFYLTTVEVLNDIVRKNNGKFPGTGIDHKLLLIREGEIKMSQIAMDLGYNLAVVLENGSLFKFGKKNRFDCGYNSWKIKKGDVRQSNMFPNKINKIAL